MPDFELIENSKIKKKYWVLKNANLYGILASKTLEI